MLFNSYQYALFLPIVLALYYLFPKGKKWIALLLASYYFYMCWNPALIALMLFSTMVNYLAARRVEALAAKPNAAAGRKFALALGVGLSLAVLVVFKYFDFFSRSAAFAAQLLGIRYSPLLLNLTLPMGISFYSFQALSYTIDVYRGETKAEKNFFRFSLYISYFPQLVAGPIERYDRLYPQLCEEHAFSYDNLREGLVRVAIGLFKKMVVADTFAKGVDTVYNGVTGYTGLPLILATVLFAFQIYCDFSGYSDIAMGSARMMGIQLMDNFKAPYLSQSIREFWSRWHISLSTWFRDYVYIPLGGSRRGKARSAANLLFTFLLSGLWHGANSTFVLWGLLHGAYQVLEKALFGNRAKRENALKWRAIPRIACTFVLVCAAWVFFRANTLNDALYVFRNMFAGIANPLAYFKAGLDTLYISKIGLMLMALELAVLIVLDALSYNGDPVRAICAQKGWVRWSAYILLTTFVVILSTKGTVSAFIYFQF